MLSGSLHYFLDILKNFIFINDNFVYKRILIQILENSLCTYSIQPVDFHNMLFDSMGFGTPHSKNENENENERLYRRNVEFNDADIYKKNGNIKNVNHGCDEHDGNVSYFQTPNTTNDYNKELQNEEYNLDVSNLNNMFEDEDRYKTNQDVNININISLVKNMKKHIEQKEFFKRNINKNLFLNVCILLFKKQNFLLYTHDIKKEYKNINTCLEYLQNDNYQYDIYSLKYFLHNYDYKETEIITNFKEKEKSLCPFISVESKNILLEISSLFFSFDYLKAYTEENNIYGDNNKKNFKINNIYNIIDKEKKKNEIKKKNNNEMKIERKKEKNNNEMKIEINKEKNFIDNTILHPVILYNVNRLLLDFFL